MRETIKDIAIKYLKTIIRGILFKHTFLHPIFYHLNILFYNTNQHCYLGILTKKQSQMLSMLVDRARYPRKPSLIQIPNNIHNHHSPIICRLQSMERHSIHANHWVVTFSHWDREIESLWSKSIIQKN